MNGKQAKKIRQIYKRDLKKKLLAEYSLLMLAIKPKPKLMPRWLHQNLVLLVMRKKYRDKLFPRKVL